MGEEVGKVKSKMEGEEDMKMGWSKQTFPWGHVKIQGAP